MFVPHNEAKFRDILDGLANTIAMGEIITDLGDRDNRGTQTNNPEGEPSRRRPRQSKLVPRQADQVDPARPRFWAAGHATGGNNNGRGYKWADFRPNFSGVHTIHPPNSAICGGNNTGQTGMFPPSSHHQGGAHVLMGDGAVIFITDSIEAGDRTAPMVWLNGMNMVPPPPTFLDHRALTVSGVLSVRRLTRKRSKNS